MGKASRRKQERRMATDRPRWAGAPGFDKSYRIAERYADVYQRLQSVAHVPRVEPTMEAAMALGPEAAKEQIRRGEVLRDVIGFQADMLGRQVATLHAAFKHKHGSEPEEKDDDPTVLPGRPPMEPRGPEEFMPYAKALATIAEAHIAQLRQATPIVFDPLAVPDPSIDALHGFALPFPSTVTDFFSNTGMSLPVQVLGDDDWWVGLVAATLTQTDEDGFIDVWPTVTTLNASEANTAQVPRELMFGTVRFGGPLPPAPEGLTHVKLDDCEAWVVDIENPEPWTALWLRAPALAAISALRLLDAVNVDLIDVPLARAARRRAEREDAKPALMVDVRTSHSTHGGDPTGNVGTIDWKQRWTVRGHWKHFGEHTAVARRHPSRVVEVPGHGRCVRIWCPPYVKGPADKPLVLKTRVVAAQVPEKIA